MSSTAVNEGSDRLKQYLTTQTVDASLVRPGQEMPTVPLAAAALGVSPGQIVKSILFEGKKDRGVIVLAIAPGDVRVSAGKVGAAAGVSQLKLASPDTVLRATGYAVGGVPPVGHATQVSVVVDSRVLTHPFVFGGGGDEHHMLRIVPQDIVRLTAARVADVVAEPEPRPAS
ncbi:YbaK/EbsC family protein [Stigmatella sp. ncwal1]|uniref:YbaK/EbsC family protein n=1 Tax=Stigmatella ashevillensis TaxID=2995309 RepID=A0ABT5D3E6_9BACT|nr:YbaK/EbsC family protein [Stigmatella ashevillena]MDC0708191.1 YbaK/EbsC family protein [Stigmatella ashevillena]